MEANILNRLPTIDEIDAQIAQNERENMLLEELRQCTKVATAQLRYREKKVLQVKETRRDSKER